MGIGTGPPSWTRHQRDTRRFKSLVCVWGGGVRITIASLIEKSEFTDKFIAGVGDIWHNTKVVLASFTVFAASETRKTTCIKMQIYFQNGFEIVKVRDSGSYCCNMTLTSIDFQSRWKMIPCSIFGR